MNRRIIVGLMLATTAHFAILAGLANREADESQRRRLVVARQRLEKLVDSSEPRVWFTALASASVHALIGNRLSAADVALRTFLESCRIPGQRYGVGAPTDDRQALPGAPGARRVALPADAFELYLFNADGRLIGRTRRLQTEAGPQGSAPVGIAGRTRGRPVDADLQARLDAGATALFTECCRPWDRGGEPPARLGRELRPLLGSGNRWRNLISRPNTLTRLNNVNLRSWGYWRATPTLRRRLARVSGEATRPGGGVVAPPGRSSTQATDDDPELIAGVLLFINLHPLDPDLPLLASLDRLQQRGWLAGMVDRNEPTRSRLPAPLTPRVVEGWFVDRRQDPDRESRLGTDLGVVVPCRERHLLVALVSRPTGQWSLGGLALWLIWLAGAVRLLARRQARPLPLWVLLALMLGLGAGLPLLVTIGFWRGFLENRRLSLEHQVGQQLEASLVSIDRHFASLLRRRRALYMKLSDSFGRVATRSEFIAQTHELELDGVFDTMFVVSSQGAMLRDFSSSAIEIRRLALAPRPERWRRLRSLHRRGLNSLSHEIRVVLDFDRARQSRNELIGMKPTDIREIEKMVGQVGREIIDQYNREHGFAEEAIDPSAQVSTMILGSLIESGGDSVSRRLASYRRSFLYLSQDKKSSYVFPNVVTDREGRGQYCLIMFHNQHTLEHRFFEELFGPDRQAMTDLRLRAISWHALATNFPHPDEWLRFEHLRDRIQPPRSSTFGVTRLDGEKVVMAAFAARHASNYLLTACAPYSEIDTRMLRLYQQLAILGVLLGGALALAGFWLHRLAVVPADRLMEGIRAMERQDLEHRIAIDTGDEWDDLAGAFNQTLIDMEELEVARLVQTRLLPSEAITARGWTFIGRTVTMIQVGGDYYDARVDHEGRLIFIIADVSGHGVSGALVVAMAKAGFGTLVRLGVTDPAEILTRLNPLFFQQLRRTKMMTAIVGCVSPDDRLQLAFGGHCSPMLIEPGRPVTELRQASLPVGISARARYKSFTQPFPPGSRVVLYTDGAVELANPRGEVLGYEGLAGLIEARRTLDPTAAVAALHRSVADYSAPLPPQDDITFAILANG